MGIALIILHVMICFILIAVILLQAGRGQGLTGASFSGSGVQTLFGTRAADFLTKATTVSAILFLFTCIGLDILEARRSRSLFAPQTPTTPLDIQQIQQVLEKIKAEEGEKAKEGTSAKEKTAAEGNPPIAAQPEEKPKQQEAVPAATKTQKEN